MSISLRPARPADAEAVAALYRAEREFLAPFEPVRSGSFFTEAGQRRLLERTAELRAVGAGERFLILSNGGIAGILSVSNIIRDCFQSATLGYFVALSHNGRGVATEAVRLAVEWAFEDVALHRLEAGTLPDNVASQRVLEKNGFRRIGLARDYLMIAGRWSDHVLFERTVS